VSADYAILLTDIVDSTRLTEQLGDAAAAAMWAAHDRAARDLLVPWHGREIDKSDGLLLLFADVKDAVGYALAYHQALVCLDTRLTARAGIHCGWLQLRENPASDVARGAKTLEVDGVAKHQAARVMSMALGGQTLLSSQAKAALLDPPQWRSQSHGHWKFRGIDEPIEIFEIAQPTRPPASPPDGVKAWRVVRVQELWLPARELPHSLSAERDSFIGRRSHLQALAERLNAGARLVSVLGIGGTGKTRLVQRFGWAHLGDFTGGVWFCDLSSAASLDGIVHAVAQGLRLPLAGDDPVGQIGEALANRGECLVILDNFEQVARHAEATVGRWLDRAGDVRFVVTTREVLGIVGEDALALPPLPCDDGQALFRARAAATGAAPFGPADEAAIAPLVDLLDGLPLAIELAASRVRVMPPRQLLARMGERFNLLRSSGGRSDRQATLSATLDWSWDLLSPPERTALAQLSVCEGGFTLEAAEAVLDLSAFDSTPWVVDVLQSLVQKSLVRNVSVRRFDLLRSVQDYASLRLAAQADPQSRLATAVLEAQARHWRYFAGLGERDAVAEKCADTENIVFACRRATAGADTGSAVGALAAAWAALKLTGPFHVALDLADDILRISLTPRQRARTEWLAGSALYLLGRVPAARERLLLALALANDSNDPELQSLVCCHLGELLTTSGDVDLAHRHLQQALDRARDAAEPALQCAALNALGALAYMQGSMDSARAYYEAALALARTHGDERWAGGLHGNLGAVFHDLGLTQQALGHYVDALALADRVGDRRWAANTRCNLGLLFHELGRNDEALQEFEAARAAAQQLANTRLESTVLCNLGIVLESQGRALSALDHFERAVAQAEQSGARQSEGQFRGYLGRLYARLDRDPEARRCLTRGEAVLREAGDRLGLGLLLCAWAEVELRRGNGAAAHGHLQQVLAVIIETGASADSELAREHARLLALDDRWRFSSD
jgi:predicted ATPase/class 3 adenylate cyclase